MSYEEDLELFIESAKNEQEQIYDAFLKADGDFKKQALLSRKLQILYKEQYKRFFNLRTKYNLPLPKSDDSLEKG